MSNTENGIITLEKKSMPSLKLISSETDDKTDDVSMDSEVQALMVIIIVEYLFL